VTSKKSTPNRDDLLTRILTLSLTGLGTSHWSEPLSYLWTICNTLIDPNADAECIKEKIESLDPEFEERSLTELRDALAKLISD